MSINYVTKKLQTQSLEEEDHLEEVPTNQLEDDIDENLREDSGSESDDEMDGGNFPPEGMRKTSFKQKKNWSSPRLEKKGPIGNTNNNNNNNIEIPADLILDDGGHQCDDNYSSEEELKEINSDRKTYIDPAAAAAAADAVVVPSTNASATVVIEQEDLSSETGEEQQQNEKEEVDELFEEASGLQPQSSMGLSKDASAEKRKWCQVSQDEEKAPPHGFTTRACSNGSSGDEEVSGLLLPSPSTPSCSCCSHSSSCSSVSSIQRNAAGGGGAGTPQMKTPTPVQFCASPPLDVYRPKHSQSPPPKLFHLASYYDDQPDRNGISAGGSTSNCVVQNGFPISVSGIFKPGLVATNGNFIGSGDHQGLLPYSRSSREQSSGTSGTMGMSFSSRETPSPNKRPRSKTPMPQNLQRPCLDFEKMQQIKKRVVTSWRPQGTELSLFCW